MLKISTHKTNENYDKIDNEVRNCKALADWGEHRIEDKEEKQHCKREGAEAKA